MFRLRVAFSTLALFVGLGAASHAQVYNQDIGVGFGGGGIPGGFQSGFYNQDVGVGFGGGGIPGFQSAFGGQQFGTFLGVSPSMGSAFPYGDGDGYGAAYYPGYGYYAPFPQTYNSMGSLMGSIRSSASRRGGWRGWP